MNETPNTANGIASGNGSFASRASGYRPGGLVAHDKPVEAVSQHTLDGEIPGFAFWLRSEHAEFFRKLARGAAISRGQVSEVQRRGADIFNGVWGIFEGQYLAAIEAVKLQQQRLYFERERVQCDLAQTARSVPVEPAIARIPSGLNGVGWWILWTLIVLVCAGEGQNVAAMAFKFNQSWLTSWLGGGLLVIAASVAGKMMIGHLVGPGRVRCERILALAGILAFVVWACCFAQNYGRPLTVEQLADNAALPDQRLQFWTQIILGCVAVIGLMAGARSLELHPVEIKLNENWKVLNERDAELADALGLLIREEGSLNGRLVEYRACRESFIAAGLAEFSNVVERQKCLDARMKELGE